MNLDANCSSLSKRFLLQDKFQTQPFSVQDPISATLKLLWEETLNNSGNWSLRGIPSSPQGSSQKRNWSPLPNFQQIWLAAADILWCWVVALKSAHQEENECFGGPRPNPLQPLYLDTRILFQSWSAWWNNNHFHLKRRALLRVLISLIPRPPFVFRSFQCV